jgi:hypothetical protein
MAHTAHSDHFANFAEFYPYYLEEHRNLVSRRLHFVGSLGVIGCIAMAIATGDWLFAATALRGSAISSSKRTALPRFVTRSTA